MSDASDYVASELSSGPSGDDSDYVASEEEEQRPAAARAAPRRGAGSGSAPRPRPAGRAAAPAAKRARVAAQPKLTDLLQSASKEQLVHLLVELNSEEQGGLEERIAALLPPPDLSKIEEELSALERKVDKAFPHAKWGSNRDNYAYKRVGPALRDLKAALLEHGRTFAQCKRHDTLLQYALLALSVTDNMPQWDAEKHNKPKQQTAKQLEGLLVKAIKGGAAPTAEARARVLAELNQLELTLPAARAARLGRRDVALMTASAA